MRKLIIAVCATVISSSAIAGEQYPLKYAKDVQQLGARVAALQSKNCTGDVADKYKDLQPVYEAWDREFGHQAVLVRDALIYGVDSAEDAADLDEDIRTVVIPLLEFSVAYFILQCAEQDKLPIDSDEFTLAGFEIERFIRENKYLLDKK